MGAARIGKMNAAERIGDAQSSNLMLMV